MSFSPLMLIHIIAGAIGVASGAAALLAPKGKVLHRIAGNVFFGSMLIMAAAGAVIAYQLPSMITVIAGLFTFYLVATAWATIRRRPRSISSAEYCAGMAAMLLGAAGIYFGLEAMQNADGLKDGLPPAPYFFFGGLCFLGAIGDILMIFRRGISGAQRIARHVWRMCLALYIAAGSLFTGPGAQAFPETWQGSVWLTVPENLVILLMLFWLGRVLFTRHYGAR